MSFPAASQAVVVQPGEGRSLDVLGELITVLATGRETNGAFTLITEVSPPGGGTPLHTHANEDEAFFVLSGAYEVKCGDQTVQAPAGAFVFAPRGVPHQLTNTGDGPAVILGLVSPPGFERFWVELSELPQPSDMREVRRIADERQLTLHLPTPEPGLEETRP
ncbi:MAG TPA: cupin domain-containing protein [Caulobacteraceae bacterium]|nr:cupin domain-containing protein [Caulobacteraceae bacterium]